jgi:hypothetical protein
MLGQINFQTVTLNCVVKQYLHPREHARNNIETERREIGLISSSPDYYNRDPVFVESSRIIVREDGPNSEVSGLTPGRK